MPTARSPVRSLVALGARGALGPAGPRLATRRARRAFAAAGLPVAGASDIRVLTFASHDAALAYADGYGGEVFVHGRTLLAFDDADGCPPELRSAYERQLRRLAA